jgi:ABC-type sugar transport system substrate-binding protein
MDRRRFLLASLGAVIAAPRAAKAQPAGKIYRVGVLDPGRAPGGACVPNFREGLRQLGYIEGQTLVVDLRFADEDPARIPVLAAELVREKPDVLWTHSPQGARAAICYAGHDDDSYCCRGCWLSGGTGPGRQPGAARSERDWG